MAKKLSFSELVEELDKIPQEMWDILESYGVTKNRLVDKDIDEGRKGQLIQDFVRGRFLPCMPIYTKFGSDVQIEGMKASIRTYKAKDSWKLVCQCPQEPLSMDRPAYVNRTPLSDEAKKNLIEVGNAGMPVSVRFGDKSENCLVSLNPYTNVPLFIKQDFARNVFKDFKTGEETNKLYGATLTAAQKKDFLDGKPVFVKGMKAGERTFDGTVQFSVFKNGVEFPEAYNKKESQQEGYNNAESHAESVAESQSQTQGAVQSRRRGR